MEKIIEEPNPYAKEEIRLELDKPVFTIPDGLKTVTKIKYIHPACAQVAFEAVEGADYEERTQCPHCDRPLLPLDPAAFIIDEGNK